MKSRSISLTRAFKGEAGFVLYGGFRSLNGARWSPQSLRPAPEETRAQTDVRRCPAVWPCLSVLSSHSIGFHSPSFLKFDQINFLRSERASLSLSLFFYQPVIFDTVFIHLKSWVFYYLQLSMNTWCNETNLCVFYTNFIINTTLKKINEVDWD